MNWPRISLFCLLTVIIITILLFTYHPSTNLTIDTTPSSPPGFIPYLQIYNLLPASQKPFAFIFLFFWLLFLFAFLGIVASDFFSPILGTISSRLGLSQSVAGVTLLALGNGAPDVFSTFAAMNAGSGSLAIGELLGAASFIVSVVAGSMSILRPFRVPRHPFLRDTGFFSLAIAFVVYIIHDGQIVRWEANALISLYIAYVVFVVFGSWFIEHKRSRRELIRIVRSEYAQVGQEFQPYHDDPDFPIQPDIEIDPAPTSPYLSPHQSPLLETPTRRIASSIHSLDSTHTTQAPIFTPKYNLIRRMRAPSLSYTTPPNLLPSTMRGPIFALHQQLPDQRPSIAPADTSATTLESDGTVGVRRRARAQTINQHRFSILGAIEFRDVVNSLARDHPHSMSLFDSPATATRPTVGHGSQSESNIHPRHRGRSGSDSCAFRMPQSNDSNVRVELGSPLANKVGYGRQRGHRASQSAEGPTVQWAFPPHKSPICEFPWEAGSSSIGNVDKRDERRLSRLGEDEECENDPAYVEDRIRIPSIVVFGDEGQAETVLPSPPPLAPIPISLPAPPPPSASSINKTAWLRLVSKVVAPSLQNWKAKSYAGRLAAVISAPAILLLTLTLPVVHDDSIAVEDSDAEGRQEDDGEEAEAEDEKDEDQRSLVPDEKLAEYLAIIQCLLAPSFALFALQPFPRGTQYYHYILSLSVGLALASWRAKLLLCFVGFGVAMVWIMCIVNEVIGVIQTFGWVVGVSDAILGLTVFAVGNSLGDLVANITVARMGFPVMAMAACFGGPMLNILLGIGLSSSYSISKNSGAPYTFDSTPTLLVSSLGLLLVLVITLVAVPANGYLLSRVWGSCLVGAYLVVLVVNLSVEMFGSGSN